MGASSVRELHDHYVVEQMKISQLLVELEILENKHGDIECYWLDDDYCLTSVDSVEFVNAKDSIDVKSSGHTTINGKRTVFRRMGAEAKQFILIG